MRDQIISYGIPRSKIKVIHNWSNGNSIKPINKNNNLLRKNGDLRSICF